MRHHSEVIETVGCRRDGCCSQLGPGRIAAAAAVVRSTKDQLGPAEAGVVTPVVVGPIVVVGISEYDAGVASGGRDSDVSVKGQVVEPTCLDCRAVSGAGVDREDPARVQPGAVVGLPSGQ